MAQLLFSHTLRDRSPTAPRDRSPTAPRDRSPTAPLCGDRSYPNGPFCVYDVDHGGWHSWERQPSVSGIIDIRQFLIETEFASCELNPLWTPRKDPLVSPKRRPSGGLVIQQVGGFMDEESDEDELVLMVGGDKHPFDRRYLSRIWPQLFKLSMPINVAETDPLGFYFYGSAIVVIAGVYKREVR